MILLALPSSFSQMQQRAGLGGRALISRTRKIGKIILGIIKFEEDTQWIDEVVSLRETAKERSLVESLKLIFYF